MSVLRRIVAWLPRDMSLPEDEFRSRHLAMTVMLLLHVPALFFYGYVVRGFEAAPLAVEVAFPLVAAVLGALPMVRRQIRMFAVTSGLIYSSVALLHLSGGAAESSLHFLIVLAFVFLYREWFLFLWAIGLMGFSYQLLELTQGVLGDVDVEPATPEVALWALMTAASIASVGLILAWKSAQDSQAATIAALEAARERDEAAERRDAYGKMYVNLARRSQSLVDRQLAVIDQLEDDVDDPDILAAVFELDHLTTRVRRHGESLLVVADVDLPVRTNQPVPLSDVVRGAQSEIEQYRRVDARIDPSIAVHGPATRDLVHVLAELLDNATTYSPPSSTVKVHARAGDAGAIVLTIEDRGLGLTPDRLAQANRDLQDTEALDENAIRHLGFRVIARLAQKHGVRVRLTSTNGGGVTAWVELPAPIVASSDVSNLPPARLPDPDEQAAPVEEPTASAPAPAPTPAPTQPTAPATPPAATPAPTANGGAPALPQRGADRPASPAATPVAPPAESTPQPTTSPATPPAPPTAEPAPATPMSAGFSASGRRGRRGRRGRSPVSGSHDRTTPVAPPATPPPAPDAGDVTPPAARPPAPRPLQTGAVRLPKPPDPVAPSPESALPTRSNNEAPPLPRRERGATGAGDDDSSGDAEALDLFGDFDAETSARSTLADFQRGQESARKEARG